MKPSSSIFSVAPMLLLLLTSCASDGPRASASASTSGSSDSGPALRDARTSTDAGSAASSRQDRFSRYEDDYRRHFRTQYAESGYGYREVRPAYEYGFTLALDPRYRDMEWNRVEPAARRGWDDSTRGLWDEYRDAVRYGWERARAGRMTVGTKTASDEHEPGTAR